MKAVSRKVTRSLFFIVMVEKMMRPDLSRNKAVSCSLEGNSNMNFCMDEGQENKAPDVSGGSKTFNQSSLSRF